MTTFTEDLFFPTEIGISNEKFDQLHNFVERCTRDVGANFDEISEFMQTTLQGIVLQ